MVRTVILDQERCGVFQRGNNISPGDRNKIISLHYNYDQKSKKFAVIADYIVLDGVVNRVISSQPTKFVHFSLESLYTHGSPDPVEEIDVEHPVKDILTNGILFQLRQDESVTKKYLFCGHSNSQLKSRSCFLYAAEEHTEVANLINGFGNFSSISTVEKRAKRIGLLFSNSVVACQLDPIHTRDIPDISRSGHVYSDGCGYISESFARELTLNNKEKLNPSSLFHKHPDLYIPSVFQIRYKGYKGILVVAPDDMVSQFVGEAALIPRLFSWVSGIFWKSKIHTNASVKVLFRDSMKKFTGCPDKTFAIRSFSKPGRSAKLNAELVTLLSTNGIPDEVLIQKQIDYYDFVRSVVPSSVEKSSELLEYLQEFKFMSRIDPRHGVPNWLQAKIEKFKKDELSHSFNKSDLEKVQIMIPNSRLLFGVCDISGKLKEGECFVKLTSKDLRSTSTLTGKVLIGRNPCLHPGDIQIFTAVNMPELSHLVDCLVFNTRGSRPAPSLLSGGDLDGDHFFISWDEELLKMECTEPEDYSQLTPVNKVKKNIGQADMIHYFASYTNSLGVIMSYYRKWVRANWRERARSSQCKELNSLYSKCVDGETIDIPLHLKKVQPPNMSKPFVVNSLLDNVKLLKSSTFGGFLKSTTAIAAVVPVQPTTSTIQLQRRPSAVKNEPKRVQSLKICPRRNNGKSWLRSIFAKIFSILWTWICYNFFPGHFTRKNFKNSNSGGRPRKESNQIHRNEPERATGLFGYFAKIRRSYRTANRSTQYFLGIDFDYFLVYCFSGILIFVHFYLLKPT